MGLVWMTIDPYPPWQPNQPRRPWIVFPRSRVEEAAAPRFKPRPKGLNYDEIYDLLQQAGTQHWEFYAKRGRRKPKTSRQLRYMLRNRLQECILSMTPRDPPPEGWPTDPYGLRARAEFDAQQNAARQLSTTGPAMLTGPSP